MTPAARRASDCLALGESSSGAPLTPSLGTMSITLSAVQAGGRKSNGIRPKQRSLLMRTRVDARRGAEKQETRRRVTGDWNGDKLTLTARWLPYSEELQSIDHRIPEHSKRKLEQTYFGDRRSLFHWRSVSIHHRPRLSSFTLPPIRGELLFSTIAPTVIN
jgi:hypothetical protein